MTLSSNTLFVSVAPGSVADGVAIDYDGNVFTADDLIVYYDGDQVATLDVHYTVTLTDPGYLTAQVVPTAAFVAALVGTTDNVIIRRNMDFLQPIDLTINSKFPETDLERFFDQTSARFLQVQDQFARSLLSAPGQENANLVLPPAVTGRALKWSVTGQLENSDADFTDLDAALAAADASAAAAAASASAASAAAQAAYADRATAEAATVPAVVTNLAVIAPDGGLLKYRRDASGTALTTTDGADWSPDGIVTPDHWGENTTPGTTDMQAFAHSAIDYLESVGGGILTLRTGNTYHFLTSVPVAGSDIKVHAHGARVTADDTLGAEAQNRPDGVFSFVGSAAATTTLSADAAQYATTVTVTSAASFAVGQAIRFTNTGNRWYTEQATVVPVTHINRVKEIAGTTITLDSPLPRALDATTFTVDVEVWSGLENVGIEGGHWYGGGFDHNLLNGIGTAAAFLEYVQNAVFKPEFVGGFSGAQMWCAHFYGLIADVPVMHGHDLGYATAIVEDQNSGFYGLRIDDGRSALLKGNLSINTRHTTDGTRAEDVVVEGWTSHNNHRPAHGSHLGCDNWKFVNIHDDGDKGTILWRGFDVMADNISMLSPNGTGALFYDTAGASGDQGKTYNLSNLKGISGRECLRLESVIDTCHLTAPDFEGAIESTGFAPIKINTPFIDAFICTGGHLKANGANHAVKVVASPTKRDLIQFNGTRFTEYTSASVQCYPVANETSLIMRGVTFDDGNSVTNHVDAQTPTDFDHLDVYGFDHEGAVYALGNQGSYDAVFGDSTIDCTLDAVSIISWTRRGERVWLSGEIRLTSENSVVGSLLLKVLPYPVAPNNRANGGGIVTWASGLTLSAASTITLRAIADGENMAFFKEGTTGHAALTPGDITDTTRMIFEAQYVTDA